MLPLCFHGLSRYKWSPRLCYAGPFGVVVYIQGKKRVAPEATTDSPNAAEAYGEKMKAMPFVGLTIDIQAHAS